LRRIGADRAARARPVVDDHRLAERLLQVRLDDARHDVVEPAGRKRHHDAHRAVGIGLRLRCGDATREQDGGHGMGEPAAAVKAETYLIREHWQKPRIDVALFR
jgi:hypothetical protein